MVIAPSAHSAPVPPSGRLAAAPTDLGSRDRAEGGRRFVTLDAAPARPRPPLTRLVSARRVQDDARLLQRSRLAFEAGHGLARGDVVADVRERGDAQPFGAPHGMPRNENDRGDPMNNSDRVAQRRVPLSEITTRKRDASGLSESTSTIP
jgi:hypothetical protein